MSGVVIGRVQDGRTISFKGVQGFCLVPEYVFADGVTGVGILEVEVLLLFCEFGQENVLLFRR
mgnify:CR=1 FL=1